MSEQDIRAERLKKLEKLRAAGMEPYPVSVERDYSIEDFLGRFDDLEKDKATVLSAIPFSVHGRSQNCIGYCLTILV